MVSDNPHSDSNAGRVRQRVAQIDKDYLDYGYEGVHFYNPFPPEIEFGGKLRFKLYDDDRILYMGGWLLDDDELLVQGYVLDWAMGDSGCTIIEVFRNGKWKAEIS